jgi:hypothetical protein
MEKIYEWFSVAVVVLCVSCSHRQVVQSSEQKPDEATQIRVAEVAASLPVDEPLRHLLEDGFRGNGIHERWMDAMKKQGVKQVLIGVKGVWYIAIGFRPDKVERVVYRTEYFRPDSQIVDDVRLERLEKSGLQRQLETVAIEKSERALWIRIDSNPLQQPGYAEVCLTDDEWLPCGSWRTDRAMFSAFEEEKYPLYSAAIYPDLVSASRQLATNHFSQTDLDTALFGAITNSSDNTKMVELLIKAGANVNARRIDGSTLLMEAASGLRVTNVKLLLSLGADPNLKNQRGDTALSWVDGRISSQKDLEPPLPDYVSEIVRLLKQAGAKT